MIILYSDDHRQQAGRAELNDGRLVPCHERPERAEMVLARARQMALGPLRPPSLLDEAPILRVHDKAYVEFLKTAWDQWVVEHGDWDALPLNWLAPNMHRRVVPESIDGKLGYYSFDAGTPITEGTWRAALAAASCAVTAADLVSSGDRASFALVRPPGHHAGQAFYGGYCFVNNAAVAAQRMLDGGAERIAILDVDYHHGNGTQEIFWERDDVLFVCVHADPRQEFPYYSGHADERGGGRGEGFTLNLPLPWGTDWPAYAEALSIAASRIQEFTPDALVVSLGADTYEGDPISRFRLTMEDFPRIGAMIERIGLPTCFVMEGGYAVDALGVNIVNVLTGFEGR
ncbi:histone deacetylase family protein [Azospirillum sp. RWY-5-1]|uniref:Histone deacetylase family protein n=1 Tax=Azospirillum oleiclasticum TaxID=2735135 RepID=A0ABX2TER5_9PROT|nr:histone deacetylase family protein [Azospirillum oleiclasticum]NYZ14919.1 histone deacetylase family protein [Azospirillum oleiclasticum]NYZ22681.1 histone deacetylase family protein [Azospirillum oleiclasticum]